MRGDLSETSAADVCRALAASGADGVLDIEGPDGRGAIVWRGGSVIAATSPTPRARLGDRLVGAGMLSEDELHQVLRRQASDPGRRRLGALLVDEGLVPYDAVRLVAQEQVLDAVFDVLRWRYGAFRLEPLHDDAIPEIPLRLPVEHLLVEVARRQQEWAELQRVIPDLAAVPSFRAQASADAALEPDEFAVLASIDGSRSVRELAADLGYGEFEAARIVYGLWLLGIVEVSPPEDEIGRALEEALAGFEELQGRAGHQAPVVDPSDPSDPATDDGLPAGLDATGAPPRPSADAPPSDPAPTTTSAAPTPPPPADADAFDLEALLERMDTERPDPVRATDDPSEPGRGPDPTPTEAPADTPAGHQAPAERADAEDTSVDAEDTSDGADASRGDAPAGSGWVEPLPSQPLAAAPRPHGGTPDEPDREPEAAPAAPPADDVAELLRELSQLSAGEEEDPPPSHGSHSGPPPPRPADRDDSKRKRRGLFGR